VWYDSFSRVWLSLMYHRWSFIHYWVAKTDRIPHLYRSFSTKETYI